MRVGAKTDQGKVRERNEDAYGFRNNLFVLADGMGGHSAGEIASSIAVETILNSSITGFQKADYAPGCVDSDPPKIEPSLTDSIKTDLKESILKANESILAEVALHPENKGMGTTVTVLYVTEGQAFFSHVGDSRIYHFSEGSLVQLTDDHSLVAELIKNGVISETEARNHSKRNILTQALGTEGALEFEVTEIPVVTGDKFLLCSDGLNGILEDSLMKDQLALNEEPQIIAEKLVSLANEEGGPDNITVIVVEI
ncbi:MAG TPA: Stp1/IreP family PP2C-type Ser/Thr phosphatase [Bacillota bacterium]|nr:Stp1/IreP family PP2C-type Ser/Thr phosphatase [Bacillota bacterium]